MVVVFALLGSTHAARAQSSLPIEGRPYAPYIALNLDAGLDLGSRDNRRHWLGAAAAGLGLFNGSHVWELTAGLRNIVNHRNDLTVALARMGVDNGLGIHAEGIWSLTDSAAGVGAGLSFSILNLEGVALADKQRTRQVSLFLRVPIGLIIHAGRSRMPADLACLEPRTPEMRKATNNVVAPR